MRIEEGAKYDFDDLIVTPKRSTIASRSEVVLERTFEFPYSKKTWTGIPLITSNMDTVGTFKAYEVLSQYNILTCFHKFYTISDYINYIEHNELNPDRYVISTGIRDEDFEKTIKLVDILNPKFLCIDVANGYSHKFIEAVQKYRKQFPDLILIGGNVVTPEMVQELHISGGLDVVKVGIGSGSACTTRILTGCGYPQLSAIDKCSDASHGLNAHMISDGGIRSPGDVAKAFCAGADFVMIGGLFAGHDESGGTLIIKEDGKQYKEFYGMSSDTAMNKHYGGKESYRASEGRTLHIPYKGPIRNTIEAILGGIRSNCTYIGARRLKDMPKCASFVCVNRQYNDMYVRWST